MSSPQQSLEALFAPSVIDLYLTRLAMLFATASDEDGAKARQTAAAMLGGYNPRSIEELALAAQTVALRFHALEALAQAALPDTPLNKVMRLRGSAVSLDREAERCRTRLERLQRAHLRPQDAPAPDKPAPVSEDQRPGAEKAAELVKFAGDALAAASKGPKEYQAFSTAFRARTMAQKIAENGRKAAERHAAAQSQSQAFTAARVTACSPGTNTALEITAAGATG